MALPSLLVIARSATGLGVSVSVALLLSVLLSVNPASTAIVAVLRQVEAGSRVEEVWRKTGISEATYYLWSGSIPEWA